MGLEDPYERYCFDEAVFLWGRYIKTELDKARGSVKEDKDGSKAQRAMEAKLKAILHPPEKLKPGEVEKPKPVEKGKFRDPMAMIAGKT